MEKANRDNSRPLIGIALIVFAILMIFQDRLPSNYPILVGNWWALFIFIPGVVGMIAAYNAYQHAGSRITRPVADAATGAIFPILLGAIFLFGLSWAWFFPAIIATWGLRILSENLPAS
jgi:hypothetical protein